jgi:uncharacterized membrane protein YhaH (DUF805 family)
MGFGQWYLRRGRITRRTWWLHYTLPLGLLAVLATLADRALGFDPVLSVTDPSTGATLSSAGPLAIAIALVTLVPSISSSATRLHDRGHSAWWLAWSLVPYVGVVIVLVQTGFLRGDGGPNRYGPPAPAGHPGSLPYRL